MSSPNLTRARELAEGLLGELDKLTREAPADAELRAARDLAAQLETRLSARGIVDPPYPGVAGPRDPDVE